MPLPVTWLYFDADAIGNNPRTAQLQWATANEVNNSHFIVEWSRDGLSWHPLGSVEGVGNSVETQTYAFTHIDADRFNLYRLKQVDLDGQFAYSAIREVVFDADENTEVTVFPNPTHQQFTVATNYPGLVQYSLLNINGQVIQWGEFVQQQTVHANPGVYLLQINTNGQVQTKRVIVTG